MARKRISPIDSGELVGIGQEEAAEDAGSSKGVENCAFGDTMDVVTGGVCHGVSEGVDASSKVGTCVKEGVPKSKVLVIMGFMSTACVSGEVQAVAIKHIKTMAGAKRITGNLTHAALRPIRDLALPILHYQIDDPCRVAGLNYPGSGLLASVTVSSSN